jgi:hypothetical protein
LPAQQLSRDITSLSKKLIFLLHRLSTTVRTAPTVEEHYAEASAKEAEVRALFGEVGRLLGEGGGDAAAGSVDEEGKGAKHAGNYWRYAKQVCVLYLSSDRSPAIWTTR